VTRGSGHGRVGEVFGLEGITVAVLPRGEINGEVLEAISMSGLSTD
jgi:hypothetical protein